MIGNAPAAETSGGIGVGPGDISRYLFIICLRFPLVLPTTGAYILDTIPHDGYIMGQRFYKLLLRVFFLWICSRASYDANPE
jgi:hypothetical protein